MAKKQTRRSISVSRGTYDRLKAYCEANQISMSQFVERRVGDFLGRLCSGPEYASAPDAFAISPTPSLSDTPASGQSSSSSGIVKQSQRDFVPRDAFSMPPIEEATTRSSLHQLSSLDQPLSQPVSAPRSVVQRTRDEPLAKDPDIKLTADQIFTF